MNGEEHYFDGGIYDPQEENRTDIYIKESGPGEIDGKLIDLTLDLVIVTGNAVVNLTEIAPERMVQLAKWLKYTAEDIMRRNV